MSMASWPLGAEVEEAMGHLVLKAAFVREELVERVVVVGWGGEGTYEDFEVDFVVVY
jgi:hypothetical protein